MWMAPALLAGLLTLALPLWLHRFARDTEEKRRYASLMLMEAAEVRRSRKRQLKFWLLLLLRLALLAALVIAFAGPLLEWRRGALGLQGSRLEVVALDTSLSMRSGAAWQRAQTAARELLEGVSDRDQAMIVAADHQVRLIAEPGFPAQRGEWLGQIANLSPSLTRLDYGTLMTALPGLIGNSQRTVIVTLITDLRASGTPLRFADLAPPPGTELRLVDVGEPAANLAIDSIGFAPDDAAAIRVTLRGDVEAAAGREVTLDIGGKTVGRRAIDAKPGVPPSVKIPVSDLGAGEFRATARLTGSDALADDDTGYALLRRITPRVLLVSAAATGDDAAYLASALGALEAPRLEVAHSTPAALASRPLADYAAVLVSDAGTLNDAAVASLSRYVNQGGAAILTLGARSQTLKAVPVTGSAIQGALVTGKVGEGDRVGELMQSHPVLRDPAGWRDIRFFRQVRVAPDASDQVLMRLAGGGPLLIEREVGAGHVLVLTSPLDREWNDLALHPLFVRFLGEATTWLAGVRVDAATAVVGGLLTASLGDRQGAQVFDPEGRRALTLDEAAGTLRFAPDRAGFYEIRGGGRSDYIAVNVDGRESDLRRLPESSVMQWRELTSPESTPDTVVAADGAGEEPALLLPVWFWMLLVAAALAFAEPLVSNYHLAVQREKAG